ncbi:hypothetical protein WJX77_006246 [Trebouxia sp. C0004]
MASTSKQRNENQAQRSGGGAELVKTKHIGAALGHNEFENPIKTKRVLWGADSTLGKMYPTIASVARQLLSMHATSCAPERNWSHWGNIYNKKRTSMKLSTV